MMFPSVWPRPFAWIALALAGLGSGPTLAQADEARAKKIVSGVCFVCHGMRGESASEVFPRLAGQNAAYIAKQLDNFKTGKRKSTAMADMVVRLSAEDMLALGQYFEKQPTHTETASNADLAAMGKYIYLHGNRYSGVAACATCHGPDAKGTIDLPRLAGQHATYLENQLRKFHERERTNDNAVMHAITSKMTALEMAAVSEYLSGK